jgi:tetratricopeptide (TPR) repeat protein
MRLSQLIMTLTVLCLTYGGAAAQSSKQTDAVARAAQALDKGQHAEALKAVDEAFKLELDGDLASRALLIRAQAHEKSGRPAQALADYNSAIWLQSLPAAERPKAVEGRQRVMAALGLASSQPPSSSGSTASALPSSSGGGIGGFFEGIFGGSPTPAPSAPAAPPPQAATDGWATRVTPERSAAAARQPSAPAQPAQPAPAQPQRQAAAAPAATASSQRVSRDSDAEPAPRAPVQQAAAVSSGADAGGFDIDFGAAASERAAKSQAGKIKSQLSDILVNRELDLVPNGSQVRIVAGPYKTRSVADALCRTIQTRGVACEVAAR